MSLPGRGGPRHFEKQRLRCEQQVTHASSQLSQKCPAPPLPRRVPADSPRQPWAGFWTRPPGVSAASAAGSGVPQCTGRSGPEVAELRLRQPSPEGLRASEGRGVMGAGRPRGGARAAAPAAFTRSCAPPAASRPGSGCVFPGLGDLSTWRCSKVGVLSRTIPFGGV